MKRGIPILLLIICGFCQTQYGCKRYYPPIPNDSVGPAGGAAARYLVTGRYMFTVNGTLLKTFDLSKAGKPSLVNSVNMSGPIVSLNAYKDSLLFIGYKGRMEVYRIVFGKAPEYISFMDDANPYDPLCFNNRYIYASAKALSGSSAAPFPRILIYDMKKFNEPCTEYRDYIKGAGSIVYDGGHIFLAENDTLAEFIPGAGNTLSLKREYAMNVQEMYAGSGSLLIKDLQGFTNYEHNNDTLIRKGSISIIH